MAGATTNSLEYFQRPWNDYKEGFGDLGSDYWIGLDTLHNMTAIPDTTWRLEVLQKKLVSIIDIIKAINTQYAKETIDKEKLNIFSSI